MRVENFCHIFFQRGDISEWQNIDLLFRLNLDGNYHWCSITCALVGVGHLQELQEISPL